MNAAPRRVELTPGYILHHQPWRDTSRILEVLTREHGRLSLFARAVRGPAARLAPVLQPFRPLLISFGGRGEAANLSHAERADDCAPLPPERVLPGFYLNELLLRLTTRHDPQPGLFDHYHATLGELRAGAPLEPALRVFEKRLLTLTGYGLELASDAGGAPLAADGYYQYRPAAGLTRTAPEAPGALAGDSLIQLRAERFAGARALDDARRLLKAALDACLEGRPLATRAVARSMVRKAART